MLLGLTGPAGVGKDTAADILVSKLWKAERTAFAKPLKEALAVLGIPEPATREAKEQLIPGRNYTWRHAAQTLGTEWGRSLSPTFWIDLSKQRYAESKASNYIITDVRFEEEADWVRSEGGVIVHVVGRQTTVTGAAAGHKSEHGILHRPGDYVLDNSSVIEALEVNISFMLSDLAKR